MATILRDHTKSTYAVHYDKAPLSEVAAKDRSFPAHWIAPNRIDVTDEFIRYARPLIGDDWVSVPLVDGLARFAKINTKALAPKKLPEYVPQTYRKKG
jgi:6-phosphofructokinase 1